MTNPTREACREVQAYLTQLRRERDRLAEQDKTHDRHVEHMAVNDRILRIKRQAEQQNEAS